VSNYAGRYINIGEALSDIQFALVGRRPNGHVRNGDGDTALKFPDSVRIDRTVQLIEKLYREIDGPTTQRD
jgi:hypothetical protein